MNRRELLALLGASLVPVAAGAQQKAMPVIGWTGFDNNNNAADGFRQGLRELGYIEGRNIAFEYRVPKGNDVSFAASIAELAALNVNIIATAGFPAT